MTTLDVAGFKARTIMPDEDVDLLEAQYPGWLAKRLVVVTSRLEAQLRKRYAVPFADPVPEVFFGWVASIVTPEAYRRRGWNAADAQAEDIIQEAKDAKAEVQQAADSVTGLFDLPLRADTTATGVTKGGPLVYSEQSPYTWTDVQARAVRNGR